MHAPKIHILCSALLHFSLVRKKKKVGPSILLPSSSSSMKKNFSRLISTLMMLLSPTFSPVIQSTTFTFVNKCKYTVWPGILSSAGEPPLSTTGFSLQTGGSRAIPAPSGWGGRFWGRTYCSQDSNGTFSCITGDCASGKVECSGSGATPPATLAEFKLDGSAGLDFFDVSLVDGYNLPMMVVPQGGSGKNCTSAGCVADLNGSCPSDLRVTSTEEAGTVACRSACDAFGQPKYCCSGAYGSPQTCKPSSYSEVFKSVCPTAYSYAYDDGTSTFTCANADYVITFCPSPNTSKKSASGDSPETASSTSPPPPQMDSTMVYFGEPDFSSSSRIHASPSQVITTGSVAFSVAARWRWQIGIKSQPYICYYGKYNAQCFPLCFLPHAEQWIGIC